MQNPVLPTKGARTHTRRVFFTGTKALAKGTAVCYDTDYGTAAEADPLRDKYVTLPGTSAYYFAGVAADTYTAKAAGQWIEIHEPGSVCEVLVEEAATINTVGCFLAGQTATADLGKFKPTALAPRGVGSCFFLQTQATRDKLCLAKLDDGLPTAMEVVDVVGAGAAYELLPFGLTQTAGAGAITAANATSTLADGLWNGQRKTYYVDGALTTNDFVVTVTTCGQLGDATIGAIVACNTLTMDGDTDTTTLEWRGDRWWLIANDGTAVTNV